MRIVREETAALVVDYQEKLVPVMEHYEQLINQSQILLQGLNVLQIPMVITQQYTKGLGTTVREITAAVGFESKRIDRRQEIYHRLWNRITYLCSSDSH